MKDTSTDRKFINTAAIVKNTSRRSFFLVVPLQRASCLSDGSVRVSFALGMATGRMTAYTLLLNLPGTFSCRELN